MRWMRWVRGWGLAIVLLAPLSVGAEGPSASGEAARGRVIATVEAAVEHWTEARALLREAEAGEARARAEGGAGSPFVAWTTEGIDGSLSRTANAQDALLLGLPFNWPGQGSAARQYADAAAEAAGLERDTIGLRVALSAGGLWVERAAWIERVAVRRARLDRTDRALNLQEARYQLGEVSGSEVMQLDLEHVRESSQLAETEAEAASRLERIRELCGTGCFDPLAGDLQVLAESTHTPSDLELTAGSVEAGVLLRRARSAVAAERARADLEAATAFGRPTAGVEWERIPSFAGVPSFDAFGVALSVPLPLGRAGRELKAAAHAEAAAREQRMEGVRREYIRRTQVARSDAEAAMARLTALNTALGELERIESSLDHQFRLGAISYLVFLDGLNRLDDVRLEAIAAREQLLLARLELAAILADSAVFPLALPNREEHK